MRTTLFATSLLALAIAAPSVQAHQAGDIIVRAGAITVQTKENTSSVKVDRGGLAGADLGGKATLGNDTQLGLNFAYMLTDHFGVELLAASPFKHDVAIKGTAGGIAAAKLGHNVVMTPGNIVYFDQAQGNSIQEPLTINGYSPLQKVYAYNPTPSNLTPQQQQRIIGVQATAWTEYMTTPQKVEYMVLPRLYALSEIAWTLPSRKDYTNFLEERLPVHLARLDSSGTVYRVPKVIGLSDTTLIGGRFSFTLKSSVKGGKIYYTIDGYTPGETDYLYDKPIQIFVPEGERRVLQAVVITPGGKRSVVTKTILNNELPLAPVAARPLAKGLNYYLVPNKEFRVTAEIDTLQASEKGVTSKIDLSKFSGKGRTYGAVFTGYINIAKDGTYIFSILSDDGSALWIDGQLVLDNDQKHFAYERPSAVRLLKGFHKIEIRYFQAGGSSQLKVYMKMQGNAKEEIPAGALFH